MVDDYLSDQLTLVCLNKDNSLIQLTKTLDDPAFDTAHWELSAMKVDNYKPVPSIIKKVCPASDLPMLAVLQDNQIQFFTEVSSTTPIMNHQALSDPSKSLG